MNTETISLDGVPVTSLRLMGEDVLVRPAPAEELRASGIIIPHAARESFGKGSEFYGVVVAVGPGRLVERGPSAQSIEDFIRSRDHGGSHSIPRIARETSDFVLKHTKEERVPLPWKVGDHVLCRQGFGPELSLREGRHHIVGRGNAEHGHGIIAAWNPEHVHCWHWDDKWNSARCGCDVLRVIETRLPSCSNCPPGERLAEATLGGEVYGFKVSSGIGPGEHELRPEDDGRHEL